MDYTTDYLDTMAEYTDFPADAAPETLESVFGDGTSYSDGLYFQSPEGNFYGQLRIVRDFYLPLLWNGEKYIKVRPRGYAPTVSSLPLVGEYDFDHFAVKRENITLAEASRKFLEDIYYWDVDKQSWEKMEWLWTIDDSSKVPYPGVARGKGHLFIKHNQQMIWDGYKWKPYPLHSNIVNDEPERHVPPGLLASVTDLQGGYNNLLASYLGNTTTGNEDLDGTATANAAMQVTLNHLSNVGWVTLAESLELAKHLDEVTTESIHLTALANSIEELVTDLDLSTVISNYSSAVSSLTTTLDDWLNATTYPLEITGTVRTRDQVESALESVITTRNLLLTAINSANISYVDAKVLELNETISGLSENVTLWFSDSVITLIEAQALKLALVQVQAESTDVIAVANSLLVPTGITSAYIEALEDIDTLLDTFVDKSSYPIEVTSQQRINITSFFEDVQSTKTLLLKAIEEKRTQTTIEYIDQQVAELDSAFASMSANIINWTVDLSVSAVESDALEISMTGVQSQADDLEAIAASLAPVPESTPISAITTAKTNFSDSLAALFVLLAPYINQQTYPVALTQNAKDAIVVALDDTRSKKLLLEDAISSTRISNLYGYVDDQIGDVNEAVGDLGDDIALASNDGYISLAEANEIKRTKAQFDAEAIDIIAIAAGLAPVPETNPVSAITTKKLAYSASLTALTNALASWITSVSYPLEIKGQVTTKAAMSTALANVKTAQAALTKEIQASNAFNLGTVSDAIGDLQDDVDLFSDDLTLMLYEASSLSSNWDTITGKYNTLISLCSTLSITATALTSAYGALYTELDTTWINQASYPKSLISGDRARLSELLTDYNEEETSIVSAINAKQAVGAFDDGFDVSQFKLVYDGFIRGFTPELELIYVSENELSLKPNYSDFEYLTVNEQNIQASKRTSVFTQTPVLSWNGTTLTQSVLAVETEYYVYLANRSTGFKIESGSYPYDYRGKLFCSGTEPSNNYLGESGLGLNAILIGRAETNASGKFIHELDVSLISRTADSKETFREFSDFDLVFVDEDTLRLQKTYGLYGQMYIPESLYYIGDDREVYTSSLRIELDSQLNLIFDDSAIAANTTYYVYIAGDIDLYNNNAINGTTGRPWHPEDVGNPSLYDADKDLRLYMFLSTVVPDNGRLDESYKGFWTRWVGTVQTDLYGKYKYSSSLSVIRQPTVNPTHLDGIADIAIQQATSSRCLVARKRGTTGIVFVNGEAIYTYDPDDPRVHSLLNSSTVYEYNELATNPLSPVGEIKDYIGRILYLYMANSNTIWYASGAVKDIFCSTQEPEGGRLSSNYPGNNSRWLATIRQSPETIGAEKVTNGSFNTDTNWIYDKGWTYSSVNKNVTHVSGVLPLSQNITFTAGLLYNIIFTISGRTTGSVVVSLGGNNSSAIANNDTQNIELIAGTGNYLYFIPTQEFNGTIDNIFVKLSVSDLVINGDFSSGSSWTFGSGGSTGWSIGRGAVSHVEQYTYLTQNITLTNSVSYSVSFNLTITAGSITPCLGGTNGTTYTTAGFKTADIMAGTSDYLRFKASADFAGSIDNVSLKNYISINNDGWDLDNSSWTVGAIHVWWCYGPGGYFRQTLSLIEGHTYSVSWTLSAGGGAVTPYIGGTAGTAASAGIQTQQIVAGSGSTIEFKNSGTSYTYSISNISITDVTEQITNGYFTSSSSWECGQGWSIAAGVASYSFILDYLTQNISLSNGSNYQLIFETSGRTKGSVTPCVSGTDGSAVLGNQTNIVDIIAGSGNYLRFKASDDYNGSIDSVSLKLIEPDLVVNGNFETNSNWELGTAWVWDPVSYHMDYLPGHSLPLSQNISAIENEYYEVSFTVGAYVAGTITPYVGGISGIPCSREEVNTQYILSGDSSLLELLPSITFNGRIDNISVKKTQGTFNGSFLQESVCGSSLTINDSVVSFSETWSSYRIQAEIMKSMGLVDAIQSFDTQKLVGLSLRLEYVDSTHIRVVSIVGDTTVFFSETSSSVISSHGRTYTIVSGSINTMYYVWLSESAITLSTSPPEDIYSKLQMTGENILIGYLGFSGAGLLSGSWNVYSFWNQPTQEWYQSITISESPTILTLNGLVKPEGKMVTVDRTGASPATFTSTSDYGPYVNSVCNGTYSGEIGPESSSLLDGSVSCGRFIPGTSNWIPKGISGKVEWVFSSVSGNIINSFSITPSKSIVDGPTGWIYIGSGGNMTNSSSWNSPSGNLRVTRAGNV